MDDGQDDLDPAVVRVLAAIALLEAQGVQHPEPADLAVVTDLEVHGVEEVVARLTHLDAPLLEPLDYASVGPTNNAGLTDLGRLALGKALSEVFLAEDSEPALPPEELQD